MASGIAETSSSSSASQPPAQGPSRSRLVQRLLGATANLPAFLNDLLSTMAVVVAGTEAAGFLIERDTNPENAGKFSLRAISHIRPDESTDSVRAAALKAFQEILTPCVQQNKDGAIEVGSPDAGEPQFCLVTLLRAEGNVVAAAAVITRCRDQERAKQRLQSMQLVAGYFELYTMRRQAEQARSLAQTHQNVLQLSAAVGTAEGFESAAMNLCNELASRTGASRVSLGWMKGDRIKVRALSHTEKFDKKQELIVQLRKTMEECADQEEPVRFDHDGERSENVTREAESLSRSQGNNTVISLPLRRKDEVLGVIALEFAPPTKLNPQMIEALITATDVLTPQVLDRHDNDRNIVVKVGKSIEKSAGVVVGPKYMITKLVVALVIAAIVALFVVHPMYHVSAPFRLASLEKRVVDAPFDEVLDTVAENPATHEKWRPGDQVHQGDKLAMMRTSSLTDQLHEAQAKRDEYENEAKKDYADHKIGDYNIAMDKLHGADAQIALVQDKIHRATITAPIDGIILQGDVEPRLHSQLREGDTLFEIGPISPLRAEMNVADRDIQELHVGQRVTIATNGAPDRNYTGVIERIVPQAQGQKDENSYENAYQVFVTLDKQVDWFRPGMAGQARVDTDKRSLAWIWTHRLIEWSRLQLWM